MTDQGLSCPGPGESHEPDQEAYRAVSGLAVAALVIGIVSVVALVDPLAALAPLAGLLVSGVALWRIARGSTELVGRKAALAGMFLSLLFGTISVGHWLAYRWILAREAAQVGTAWFELMARGQPQWAHQLTMRPDDRAASGGDGWAAYRANQQLHEALEKHLAEPLPRTLLALGTRAKVRLYATEKVDATFPRQVMVSQLYAVTFDKEGKKTTFLVRLVAQHVATQFADRAPWRVAGIEGGVKPGSEEEGATD